MPRTSTGKRTPPVLHTAHESIAAAWKQAARDLKPAFARLGGGELDLERGIVSAVPGGVVSHAPIRLRRPKRAADLWQRPHVVAALLTTRSLVDLVTEAIVLPGAYAVRLRPAAGHGRFAFDLHDATGKRVLATAADSKPTAAAARARSLSCFGVDVDIDQLDDIVNPFEHVICLSFLEWRWCFGVPRWIWPA